MTSADDTPNVLDQLGIDLTALTPEAIQGLSPTRVLDVVTAQLLAETVWGPENARLLTALLEDPELPDPSRNALVEALAHHIHTAGWTQQNDPYTFWQIGDALFAVNYTAFIDTEARTRLARALAGYNPIKRHRI